VPRAWRRACTGPASRKWSAITAPSWTNCRCGPKPQIKNRRTEGNALGNLGNAYAHLGQTGIAIGFYEQQLEIAREIEDRRGEGSVLGSLGIAYARLGQTEKAIGFLEQAITIGQEIKDPRIISAFSRKLAELRGDAAAEASTGEQPNA
jgi:tetratricopeptide (TPR) repeat protein